MCGRYTLRTPLSVLIKNFELDMSVATEVDFDLPPRYNVAPTQQVAVVRASANAPRRDFAMLRWGLIPFWADNPSIGNRLLNARSERVAVKPAFREAFKRRRCLVVADGYYEWRKAGKVRQPYLFQFPDERPFAFAGLWESWRPQKDAPPIESCTLITTEANELSRPIHDRMPVIIDPSDYATWLDQKITEGASLQSLLRPWEREPMVALRVSTKVNNPRNDDATCVEPWE